MYGIKRMVYRRPVNYFESRRIKIWKEIIELAKSESYQALGEYQHSTTKMDFICNKNHEFSMTPNDFKKGILCPACARERITAAAIVTANKLKVEAAVRFTKYLTSKGYIAKSPYESSTKKITLQCSEGHTFTSSSPRNFKLSKGCKTCYQESKRVQKLIAKNKSRAV